MKNNDDEYIVNDLKKTNLKNFWKGLKLYV